MTTREVNPVPALPGYVDRLIERVQACNSFIELTGAPLDELLTLKQLPIDAVPTPFPKWNSRCRDFGGGVGLARGWHVTLAGNPGHGKSLIALNCAAWAIRQGEHVGIVSLEMSWQQLTTRLMAIVSGELISRLEPGASLNPETHKRAAAALDRIKERSGGSVRCNRLDISELADVRDAVLRLYEEHGCRFIIIDYMQLVEATGAWDRTEATTQISHTVRGLAKRHKLVTLGLSQFNRETSKDYDNPPTPQGLMGGSPMENDSDQIVLIDHTTYARHVTLNSAQQSLILGKNRHGANTKIECRWNYDNLRITQLESSDPDIAPELATADRGEAWEPEL